MAEYQQGTLNAIRGRPDYERAVVFLHGFSGDRDDTWDRLPGLLGTVVADWDIYTLGYATTFRPDLLGVWSADPDLPILATMLTTQASIDPLRRYRSLAVVAHSMGGLVVQRALVDDPKFANRTEKVVLFGTPSAGLRKASWLFFWKRQLKNMATGSEFITELRQDWTTRFEREPRFDLRVVAGDQDQFVPPKSSLGPFPRQFHSVVPGNHLSMVRAGGYQFSEREVTDVDPVLMRQWQMRRLLLWHSPQRYQTLQLRRSSKRTGTRCLSRMLCAPLLHWSKTGKRAEAMALLQRYQTTWNRCSGYLSRSHQAHMDRERGSRLRAACAGPLPGSAQRGTQDGGRESDLLSLH